jgi:hypothetical protein
MSRFDDNIKICPKEAGWKVVGWIDLSRYKKKRLSMYFENDGEFLFCKVRCISGLAKEVLDFQEGLFPT